MQTVVLEPAIEKHRRILIEWLFLFAFGMSICGMFFLPHLYTFQ